MRAPRPSAYVGAILLALLIFSVFLSCVLTVEAWVLYAMKGPQ